jgi:hypothetical protein
LDRKKILRRAALMGASLLVVSLVVDGIASAGRHRARVRQQADRDGHLAGLGKEYQAYLDETAKKITALPVDPRVIGEVQTRHYQQRPARWMYVWGADNKGTFLFGVPTDEFARLNTAYDQNQEVIARDNHFANRDQFLRTFLHEPRRISPPKSGEDKKDGERDPDADWWRFYRDSEDYSWGRRNTLFLSSPIQDASGATVGNLNLKLVEAREEASDSASSFSVWSDVQDIAHVTSVLSLVWLWFMLPTWVYIDAQQRGVPRPLLWALLTVIGSVFALMVYLISRPAGVAEFRCPHCSKPLNGSKAGCPYCGADLSAVFCPRCQYPVKPDWSFCPSCRGALVRTPAAPEEPAGA